MKENEESFLIDTNVLVYAYTDEDKEKQKIAQKLLEPCWKRERYYYVSLQNLAEFFVAITKKGTHVISSEQAHNIIQDIIGFSHWKIIQYSSNALLSSTQRKNKDFWDTLIAATMLENGIQNVYTEDLKGFSIYSQIKARNPFEEKK